MRQLLAALAAAAALCVCATSARAATVEVVPSSVANSVQHYAIRYTAAPGEANDLTIAGDSLRDAGATIQPGSGCATQGDAVVCTIPAGGGRDQSTIDLGDGDDRARVSGLDARVNGGAGADDLYGGGSSAVVIDGGLGPDRIGGAVGANVTATYITRGRPVSVTALGGADDGEPGEGDDVGPVFGIVGSSSSDFLAGAPLIYGGPGHDRLEAVASGSILHGEIGIDTLVGGPGPDTLDGGPGPDSMTGGGGTDVVDYTTGDGVHVTLDDVADDGRPGEADNAASDIEDVRGSEGDDTIVGSARPNRIDGGLGNDAIDGGGGNDVIDGGIGFNLLDGGPGADELISRSLDRLDARDGERDVLRCEVNVTREPRQVVADAGDESSCAHVGIAIAPPLTRASRTGVVQLPVACPAGGTACAGTLRFRRGAGHPDAIVERFYRLAAGRQRTYTLRLPTKIQHQLKRARKLRFAVEGLTYGVDAPFGARKLFPAFTVLGPRTS